MRIIIKDFLQKLKEKDELDLILCDLLLQMGYITDNIPKTGNRQYGVDIQAHTDDELMLFVIKQGNINRSIWNDGQNAVRQSLDEIFDVYINSLTFEEQNKKIKIIVATNGIIEESVKRNWDGYVNNHNLWRGRSINITFWGIDDITYYVQQYLFDEHLFDVEMQSLLRRALYFIEELDYRNDYFEIIIDCYIQKITELPKLSRGNNNTIKKKFHKESSSLFLASQMIAYYASSVKRYKISIMVSEYLIIRYWKFLFLNDCFEEEMYCVFLQKCLKMYEKWNICYYEMVKKYCEDEELFPRFNTVLEQRLSMYEILGFLSSYAFYESFYHKKLTNKLLNTIVLFLNNYPQILYAPYDDHITQIAILFRLWTKCDGKENLMSLLKTQTVTLANYYLIFNKYPTPTNSFEDAMNIEFGNSHEDYDTSGMWGYFLLWISKIDYKDLYNELVDFLAQGIRNVTKCFWILRKDEEKFLYDKHAMNLAGEGAALMIGKNYEDFYKKNNLDMVLNLFETENFSYDEYSFPALEIIVSRYYGYVPRVKND